MERCGSLQNGKVDLDKSETSMNRKHVRSVVVFPPAVEHLPTLENFKVLRVLDFGDCDISQGYSLKYLGNLLQLRYLGLRNTCIDQLHEEIGKLRFLQTLEVWGHKSKISSLPSTIVFFL
jgi:Leucine-rich repeat (LRR) protein